MPNCVECGEVITNPVCEECLANEFVAWLGETDASLELKFREQYSKRADFVSVTYCVLCKNPMIICPHCATTQFVAWLESCASPVLVNEALDFFAGSEAQESVKHFAGLCKGF